MCRWISPFFPLCIFHWLQGVIVKLRQFTYSISRLRRLLNTTEAGINPKYGHNPCLPSHNNNYYIIMITDLLISLFVPDKILKIEFVI